MFFHIRASDSSLKSGWPVMCTFCAHGWPMGFSGMANWAEGWEFWVPPQGPCVIDYSPRVVVHPAVSWTSQLGTLHSNYPRALLHGFIRVLNFVEKSSFMGPFQTLIFRLELYSLRVCGPSPWAHTDPNLEPSQGFWRGLLHLPALAKPQK